MTARRTAPSPQLTLFLTIEGGAPAKPEPPDVDALFREFYAAYPRRVAVKAARKAFGTALKEATFDQIMGGVASYAEEIKRRGTRPVYIAHPASWLNAGRWTDEPDQPPTNTTTASFARIGLEFRAASGVRR